jgi:hypothetical protein
MCRPRPTPVADVPAIHRRPRARLSTLALLASLGLAAGCQAGSSSGGGTGGGSAGAGGSGAGGAGARGGGNATGGGGGIDNPGGTGGSTPGGSGGAAGVSGAGGGSQGGTGGGAGAGGSAGAATGGGGAGTGGSAGAGTGGGSAGTGGGGAGAGGSSGPPAVDPNCMPSKHYGKMGELWKPDGRIVDASYAGYHTGMDPIPDVAGPMKSVTEFGAKGDDMADDSAAFLAAIAGTDSGVLLVPAGRYILTKQIVINKSNFVLRGEGQGKSILYFPRPLSEVGPPGTSWSFNGGFVTVSGSDAGPQLAMVTANVPRGARELPVSSTAGIKVGDWVRIIQTDQGGSLFRALYGGMHPGNVSEDGGTEVFRFYSKVTAVGAGSITLERHLPLQVDTNWSPQVRAVMPTAREVGVEKLTLEMAAVTYPGHFNERGYNGIYYVGAHDSWVRDVQILNGELGISIYRSFFVTVTGVVLDGTVNQATIGHHGLNSARGSDIWFTKFEVKKKYIHDLTVDGYALGTVWSEGKGIDMNMDHHGRAPYGTLWTNLDLGRGTRAFDNGGAGNRLPPTASYTTVWNVYGAGGIELPPSSYGPNMNFVGAGNGGVPGHWSLENIPRASLCQPDLHAYMLARRR